MDPAYTMLLVWALIGALAAGLIGTAPNDRAFFGRVVDGVLGGCLAGSLFHKLELSLPFYVGSLLAALVGAVLVVAIINRCRAV